MARRAGVNIATLYRRFPDRAALIRQLVLDGFHLVLETARVACRTARTDPLRDRELSAGPHLSARHARSAAGRWPGGRCCYGLSGGAW
ncbi:TetR family transcriptional regulator [Streptomyces sp. YGL11-2]|uniref:TetR family transcriptional regulator n=1 Tax=Streptomyces sp. YGL11-2 TaxID=3414028 RepID=UPI003CEFAFCD